MNEIKPGQKYKHFKGGVVTIIGIGKNSENYDEEFVVYTHPYEGHEQIWIRPIAMFLENIERPDYSGPRFKYLE